MHTEFYRKILYHGNLYTYIYNFKMDNKEMGHVVDLIRVADDRDQRQTVVKSEINFWVP
jgi:hypothetical protein